MRKNRLVLACILAVFFWLPGLNAGTLRQDHEQLELKRKALEKKRMEYEIRLRVLSSRRYSLSLDLNKCVAGKNLPTWEDRLRKAKSIGENLETERRDLINLRIELARIRNDHETRRAAIESKYRGKTRGKPYDAELRQYMESLETQYFDRVEKELFLGYQEYLAGIENYLMFMEEFINECRTRSSDKN